MAYGIEVFCWHGWIPFDSQTAMGRMYFPDRTAAEAAIDGCKGRKYLRAVEVLDESEAMDRARGTPRHGDGRVSMATVTAAKCNLCGSLLCTAVICPNGCWARQGWPTPIPVGERLPSAGQFVLMYESNGDDVDLWTSGWFDNGEFFSDADSFLRLSNPADNAPAKHVTHWLPRPPRMKA